MKTLFLIRHAKSSWGDPNLPDRSRPLEARGERAVANMGKRLSQRHVRPDLIVSSPAVRALSTARVIATADVQIAVIEALDAAVGCVMLVGHNPEFTELVHRSSSEITGMPTCAVAEFEFKVKTWKGIGRTRPVSFGLRLSDEQGRLGRQAGSIVGTECSVRPGRV
jgi:phosphohistidine phosphatase